MARIIQGTSSAGYGGLEMVIHDFHSWLISQGHDASVFVMEGTALHKSMIASGFADSTIVFSVKDTSKQFRNILKAELNSPSTAFLFHRHAGLKTLAFQKPQAKISVLSHTFYKSRKRDPWHRYLFSKVDNWIALSELHKNNLFESLALNPQKVKVIPNGVNLTKFRAENNFEISKDEIHIAIVARLDPQKGQDLAIAALAKLKKQTTKKLVLHFFGDETPEERSIKPDLEALVKKYDLSNEVIFNGFTKDIEKILPSMDLLWLPSLRETFGRCLIEAMACGVPVVASNAGACPTSIQNKINGMLFETQNADDLVKQTLFLIENSIARQAIREQALADVQERYDLEKVFRAYSSRYCRNMFSKKKSFYVKIVYEQIVKQKS